jgi:polyisoprenyl-phosphate glycosyltransferase
MISVIIPAYNEADAIGATINDIQKSLDSADIGENEIVVVDDGSSDKTSQCATDAGARVVQKLQNLGYGHSLKVGIAAAHYDTIVIIDGDGTYPTEEIPRLINMYREGYNMVVGARTGEHYRESWFKAPLRRLLRFLVEFSAGRQIPDANSGLRVFSRHDIMPMFPFLSNAFSFTTSSTLAYMLQNKYVAYTPIAYHERIGKTKVRLLRDSLRVLQHIVAAILYYNPIKLFLAVAICMTIIGTIFFALALTSSSSMLAAAGIVTMLVAVLVFTAGLLAEAIRQYLIHEREYKETAEKRHPSDADHILKSDS